MTTPEKLDQIVKSLTELKTPSISNFLKATAEATKKLDGYLKEEYDKGYKKAKEEIRIIKQN